MLLLLLNYVVLRALWKIDVHLISTLVNKSIYYYTVKITSQYTVSVRPFVCKIVMFEVISRVNKAY